MGNNTMLRNNKGIMASVLGLGLLGGISSDGAYADIYKCGAVLNDGGVHKLTKFEGPCDGPDPALTVVGPTALLIEDGVRVSCEDGDDDDDDVPDGIVILGHKAKVIGGTVTGCDEGVEVNGDGEHLVKGMHLISNTDKGIDINSDRNTLINNTANRNDDDGFKVDGDHNKFIKNTANGNKSRGFEVDGDKNLFSFGKARENESDGFRLDNGNGNTVIGMNLSDNDDDGMEVNSDDNKITLIWVVNNAEDGIQLSVERDDNNNIESTADNNTVLFNFAKGNGKGRPEQGCELGKVEEQACDLEDQNQGCAGLTGTNRWRGNKFGTRNQDCIQ